MGAATCAAVLQPLPISHQFHGCTALLVLRFVVVKWRYIKCLALLLSTKVTKHYYYYYYYYYSTIKPNRDVYEEHLRAYISKSQRILSRLLTHRSRVELVRTS